jgi:isopentenyl diphosphate isomerase/L-lactate dehydrogenase-like FMN-dependent dehydrogenase
MILPKIAKLVNHQIPIFVDCCMESGMDAYKALALGATAVCVGRKLLNPLKDNGAEGIRESIEEITKELAGVMASTCAPELLSIDSSVIWKRDF